jgi:hypothetical protein
MECQITSINDEWQWRLEGEAKTMAVSQNLVPRMPWERLCFGMEPLPGVSQIVSPPDTLLRDNRNARDACLALFDGSGRIPTFLEMKEKITTHAKDLRTTNRSFGQEIAFLLTVAEPLVDQKVRDQIVALFPGPDQSRVALADAYKGVEDIKRSELVMCSDPSLQKEVEAVALFLNQLLENRCPAAALAPATSKFFSSIRELAEGFLTTSSVTKVGMFTRAVAVNGKQAMELLYQDFDSKGGDVATEHLLQLKTYLWMLSEEQRQKVNAKVSESIVQARNQLLPPKAITGPSAPSGSSSSTDVSSGSSASGALVAAIASVQLNAAKRKSAWESSEPGPGGKKTNTARLHSIFRGKRD